MKETLLGALCCSSICLQEPSLIPMLHIAGTWSFYNPSYYSPNWTLLLSPIPTIQMSWQGFTPIAYFQIEISCSCIWLVGLTEVSCVQCSWKGGWSGQFPWIIMQLEGRIDKMENYKNGRRVFITYCVVANDR